MERVKLEPRVRRQRRAFSHLAGRQETGGDPALAALFDVDPAHVRALTHGFHSYAGRMHPSTARRAILAFSSARARILDPFCGSGTVLVEAMAHGRIATGVDASPLAVAIAQVRTTPLSPAGRERLMAKAAEIGEASAERARKRRSLAIPRWARREITRFEPHVALELLGLRTLVMETAEDEVGRALRMCLSSILVKFMRDAEHAQRIARGLPSVFFAGRARELARGLDALERATPADTPAPTVRAQDARAYPSLPDASFDLVLSSPPYAGTYDYAEHHDVRFLWLGLERETFERSQVGARAHGLGAPARAWSEGRRRWLAEMGRVLAPGGQAVLVVGDGVVGDRPEDAANAIAAAAPAARLEPIARAFQARPIHDRRLRDLFGGPTRREHVVLLRRT